MKHKSHAEHKHHHSDPIVGGESERESRPWGHGQYANMPQEVRMQEYPKIHHDLNHVLDDTEGRLETDAANTHHIKRATLDRGMY